MNLQDSVTLVTNDLKVDIIHVDARVYRPIALHYSYYMKKVTNTDICNIAIHAAYFAYSEKLLASRPNFHTQAKKRAHSGPRASLGHY